MVINFIVVEVEVICNISGVKVVESDRIFKLNIDISIVLIGV